MKTTSQHAAAAKMIRAEIKAMGIKAKVRSESYSGGSSIRIEVIDQSAEMVKKLEEIAGKYEQGHFDGMTDCYYMSNVKDYPQVKFVFVENELSEELKSKLWLEIKAEYADIPADADIHDYNQTWGLYGYELVRRKHYSAL